MCHMSHVRCHLSHVRCQVPGVTCHVSVFFVFFWGKSGGASRWRVCYQRGLPRLVWIHKTPYMDVYGSAANWGSGQIFNTSIQISLIIYLFLLSGFQKSVASIRLKKYTRAIRFWKLKMKNKENYKTNLNWNFKNIWSFDLKWKILALHNLQRIIYLSYFQAFKNV